MSEAAAAADDDPSRRVWFVDLVLGAWRPREAASQLALGLGVELTPLHDGDPGRAVFAEGRRMIDVEAAGEPTVMTAWSDAERIAPALSASATVALLTPRYGLPHRLENEWFVLLLRRLGVSIAYVGDEPAFTVAKPLFDHRRIEPPDLRARPWLPEEHLRLLRFFPGLLPRRLAEQQNLNAGDAELLPFGADHFLIPMIYRDRDPAKAGRDLDAMAGLERHDEGLRGLCQSYCTGYFVDVPGLVDLSRRQFRSGGIDLAKDLAGRARLVARRPEDAALADLRRQELRIVESRFSEVAKAPESSRLAPAPLREKLALARIVGEMMTGEIAAAERHFAPLLARLKAEERIDPDDLLLLGALADARIGKGDIGGGYFLAEAVQAALDRDPDADPRVVFRNALALARIHRSRADSGDYRAALTRAFATSAGARTPHEIVELNVLAGGDPERQSDRVRLAWLRAALAWLAVEPAEGLSRRAVEAILGSAASPRTQFDIDISETLADALVAAWPNLPAAQRQKFPVVRRAGGPAPAAEQMMAGPGAGVLWSPDAEIAAVYARPRQRLIRLVLAGLEAVCPRIGETVSGTILIDANLGMDIPRTREEALTLALRAGAKEFVFGSETLFLDETLRPRLAADLRVSLSPIVRNIVADGERRIVRFRRHLPEKTLTPAEARVVAELAEGAPTLAAMSVVLGEAVAQTEARLRPLEAERVIRLEAVAR